MAQNSQNLPDSRKQIELLLEKIATLENMILLGNKVYRSDHTEKLGNPLLQAKITIEQNKVMVGETFSLEMEIANFGSSPAIITGIEELIPCCGMELISHPDARQLDGSYIDLSREQLEASDVKQMRFSIRAIEKGTYILAPRITYMNGRGAQKIINLQPLSMEVEEIILPNRVSTGFKDLDHLLFGGLPDKYSIVISSISCDETKLLINRFLETGIRAGEITFLITLDASRLESLAKEFDNFHLFVCSPPVNTSNILFPNLQNISGIENLTDINIPLISALRKLDPEIQKPRRICIEILSDILLQHQAVRTRKWLITIVAELKSRGFTTLAVINPHMHPAEDTQAVLDLFDGEIDIYENANQKFLRIRKLYDQTYLENELTLRKTSLSNVGLARKLRYQSF
jgi:KaiC/GvpD/RAD55 family RecA-like ATPase